MTENETRRFKKGRVFPQLISQVIKMTITRLSSPSGVYNSSDTLNSVSSNKPMVNYMDIYWFSSAILASFFYPRDGNKGKATLKKI